MTDDLTTPLGLNKPRQPKSRIPALLSRGLLAVLVLPVAGLGLWVMTHEDPFGGEPMAVIAVDMRAKGPAPGTAAKAPAIPDIKAVATTPTGVKTVTMIDGSTGKRVEVTLPGNGNDTPASPAALKPPVMPSQATKASADSRFLETTRHGLVPRIAADGTWPSEAFAQPVKAIPGKPDAPRIAVIVGGLGVSAASTDDAINKLPAAVTLAFTPYSANIEQLATKARERSHELMLHVPMEPFDYPDNDPGPQTLLTTLDAGQNIDRLMWLMSRFQGYVGIANYMGARFTSSDPAMAPVLRETGKRGLVYLDDGGSSRSVAGQIAGTAGLPFAKADVVIDTLPTAADVDRALAQLEAIARQRGAAVGIAGALPISIERIARWAKTAESRGILLVPITAVAGKAKSS